MPDGLAALRRTSISGLASSISGLPANSSLSGLARARHPPTFWCSCVGAPDTYPFQNARRRSSSSEEGQHWLQVRSTTAAGLHRPGTLLRATTRTLGCRSRAPAQLFARLGGQTRSGHMNSRGSLRRAAVPRRAPRCVVARRGAASRDHLVSAALWVRVAPWAHGFLATRLDDRRELVQCDDDNNKAIACTSGTRRGTRQASACSTRDTRRCSAHRPTAPRLFPAIGAWLNIAESRAGLRATSSRAGSSRPEIDEARPENDALRLKHR